MNRRLNPQDFRQARMGRPITSGGSNLPYFNSSGETRFEMPTFPPPGKGVPMSGPWWTRGSWTTRLLLRILIVIVCAETLYIVSGVFAHELLCDDLRLELQNVRQDYERSQLVVKTLTLSCNETEYDNCLRSVESTQQKFVQTQLSLGKRLDSMTTRIDKCKKENQDLRSRLQQGAPSPGDLSSGDSGSTKPNARANNGASSSSSSTLESANEADNGSNDMDNSLEDEVEQPLDSSIREILTAKGLTSLEASGLAPGGLAEAEQNPWLVIGIPTIPRKDNIDYLSRTLAALVAELPRLRTDPLFELIRIVVMNNKPGEHPAFAAARRKYGDSESPWAGYFDFVDNVDRNVETPHDALKTQKDARRSVIKSGGKPGKPPTSKVQQQTRDVVQLLKYVHDQHHPAHYLFMEDDFVACPRTLEALRYAVSRVSENVGGDWLALRASFGLNGVLIQGDDLPALTNYLNKHQARREPDHLTSEWYLGETPEAQAYRKSRTHAAFRYNLFEHIGAVSTLRRSAHKQKFPSCWAPLVAPIVFAREAFNKVDCPDADVWPCTPPPGQICDEDMLICDNELSPSTAVFAKP